MPTCSILITNYNNAPYLRACIDSALAQTRPADEIIVYDDGSTDASGDILASYGDRIRTVLAPHFSSVKRRNLVNAVNQCFARARGDFMFYLDGDDAFLPGKLETYLAAFDAHPGSVLVQGPLLTINRDGARTGEIRHEWAHNVEIGERVRSTHDLDFFYPNSSIGLRASFLKKIMPLDLSRYSLIDPDIAFCINAILRGRVVTLDRPWTLYRQHGSNMSLCFRQPFYRQRFDWQINRYHNECARALGVRSLALWRNTRFLRRSTRHLIELARAPFAIV